MHNLLQDIGGHSESARTPSILAATATESHNVFTAPFAGRIKKIHVVPQASVTGDDTDRKNLNFIDKGSDGLGAVEVANLDLVTGTDLTAFKRTTISAVLDNRMAAGDVLVMEAEKIGGGVLLPDMLVLIEFEPDHAP